MARKYNDLYLLLSSDEGRKLPYETYVKLQKDLEYYDKEHERLKVELDIWGQAREICMELADEVFKEK